MTRLTTIDRAFFPSAFICLAISVSVPPSMVTSQILWVETVRLLCSHHILPLFLFA